MVEAKSLELWMFKNPSTLRFLDIFDGILIVFPTVDQAYGKFGARLNPLSSK